MKKILFLVNHDLVIYNFRKELVIKLLELGYKVYISSPYGKKIDKFVELGCEFIETKINRRGVNPLQDYKVYEEYKRIIKKIKPDVVLTYTIKPNIYGGLAAKKCKVPYIANITGLGTAVEKKGLLQFITVFLYKKAFKKIDTMFFQNQENMVFFEKKKIKPNKHKLIPGSGVNLEEFKLIPYPEQRGKHNFIFIGRIMKNKGVNEFLYAASILKEKYGESIEFRIAGFIEEEDLGEEIKKLHKDGKILYLGFVDDIKKLLEDIHCVILPSYHEGMSNTLLEAQSSGRPVIGTDIPGIRETFIDKKSGILCKKGDAIDLINKIELFIELPTAEKIIMGKNGRDHVEVNFDRNIIINEYIKKIEESVNYV